jgi:regulator of replication initiation timing
MQEQTYSPGSTHFGFTVALSLTPALFRRVCDWGPTTYAIPFGSEVNATGSSSLVLQVTLPSTILFPEPALVSLGARLRAEGLSWSDVWVQTVVRGTQRLQVSFRNVEFGSMADARIAELSKSVSNLARSLEQAMEENTELHTDDEKLREELGELRREANGARAQVRVLQTQIGILQEACARKDVLGAQAIDAIEQLRRERDGAIASAQEWQAQAKSLEAAVGLGRQRAHMAVTETVETREALDESREQLDEILGLLGGEWWLLNGWTGDRIDFDPTGKEDERWHGVKGETYPNAGVNFITLGRAVAWLKAERMRERMKAVSEQAE